MSRSKLAVVFACALGIALSGCGGPPPYDGPPADLIFFGDNIVTMDPDQPTVEAVAVLGETITAAGRLDDVMAHRGDATRVVDLGRAHYCLVSSTPMVTSWGWDALWTSCLYTRRQWVT